MRARSSVFFFFFLKVMSAVWSCSLVHYMIPTELHTVFFFFLSHCTPGNESMQHCNIFATCQGG